LKGKSGSKEKTGLPYHGKTAKFAISSYFTYNEQPLILRAQEAASNHNGELIFSANV
jgi:hypothetical protein